MVVQKKKMINPQLSNHIILQTLAIFIDKIGYQVDNGKEIFISDKQLESMTKTGQIQVDRHETKPGFVIRYFPNKTIQGVESTSNPKKTFVLQNRG